MAWITVSSVLSQGTLKRVLPLCVKLEKVSSGISFPIGLKLLRVEEGEKLDFLVVFKVLCMCKDVVQNIDVEFLVPCTKKS